MYIISPIVTCVTVKRVLLSTHSVINAALWS